MKSKVDSSFENDIKVVIQDHLTKGKPKNELRTTLRLLETSGPLSDPSIQHDSNHVEDLLKENKKLLENVERLTELMLSSEKENFLLKQEAKDYEQAAVEKETQITELRTSLGKKITELRTSLAEKTVGEKRLQLLEVSSSSLQKNTFASNNPSYQRVLAQKQKNPSTQMKNNQNLLSKDKNLAKNRNQSQTRRHQGGNNK